MKRGAEQISTNTGEVTARTGQENQLVQTHTGNGRVVLTNSQFTTTFSNGSVSTSITAAAQATGKAAGANRSRRHTLSPQVLNREADALVHSAHVNTDPTIAAAAAAAQAGGAAGAVACQNQRLMSAFDYDDALYVRNEIIIALTLEAANVNSQDKDGDTALKLAVEYGDIGLVNLLLGFKANVNIANNEGVTPLMAAAKSGNNEMVTALLTAGAAVDTQDVGGDTALTHAAYFGRYQVAQTLVAAEANISIVNNNVDTALILAVIGAVGHPDDNNLIRLLATTPSLGQNVFVKNNQNHHALFYAHSTNNAYAIRLLTTSMSVFCVINAFEAINTTSSALSIEGIANLVKSMFEFNSMPIDMKKVDGFATLINDNNGVDGKTFRDKVVEHVRLQSSTQSAAGGASAGL